MRKSIPGQAGFSLIELLVVLVILGLLAGLVLPNVLGKLSGAQHKSARNTMVVLQSAIDGFALDNARLPDDLQELVEKPSSATFWNGPYVKRQNLTDPWDNAWVYRKPGQNGRYDLISYGEDGSPGGEGTSADIKSWEQ